MHEREKISLTGEKLFTALRKVCTGLVFVSETDSPVEPFLVEKKHGISLAAFTAGKRSFDEKNFKTDSATDFFERLTRHAEWYGEREIRAAARFSELRDLIFGNLIDVELIRVGSVRIEIVIVGRDAEGNLAGVKTSSVET